MKIVHLSLNLFVMSHQNWHLQSMSNASDYNENDPTEVFRGTGWEVALVQNLLENAEIRAYVYYGGRGMTAPWDSRGCFLLNRVMVSSEDYEKAKEVVNQYYQAIKSDAP